jgi:hypothetical protein
MDPDWYFEALEFKEGGAPMGIRVWLKQLKLRFPRLRFGYFNPPLR